MRIRYLIRFCLIALGFALTLFGVLAWHDTGFDLAGVWPMASDGGFHPVYPLVLGMALIPPSLWEVFILEQQRAAQYASESGDDHG